MRSFKYDGDHRMVDFRVTAGGVLTQVRYRYDGEGRRISKEVVGGGTTTYVYNALGQLAAEYAGRTPAGLRYLTADPLGSTRVVTGQDRSVLTRHDYLPFGQEIEPARGNRAAVSGYTASLIDGPAQKFTGKERDAESRLDYFQARYFSGAGGRFTSVDPENAGASPADPQSWNGYAYARNNPLLYVDPDGRYFIVCQSDGDCTAYANDSDFYTFLKEENLQFSAETDEDGNLLPTNIYSVDERGNRTLYGRAIHTRHAPGLEDKGLGPLELALGTGLTSLARKGAANNLWDAARNLFRGKSSSGAMDVATEIGLLRGAAKGKGNFSLGSGTRADADRLGKAWVGDGYRVSRNGEALVSADGMRIYRPPRNKGRLGKIQANFERKVPGSRRVQSNGHLDITD